MSYFTEQGSPIACSTFRSQMASLLDALDALDAGGSPIVLVHRRGMGKVKSFYIVEKVS
jgi:hypothetical protein